MLLSPCEYKSHLPWESSVVTWKMLCQGQFLEEAYGLMGLACRVYDSLAGSCVSVGDLVLEGTLLGRTVLEDTDNVFWSLQLHDDQILCHSLHPAFFTALQAGGNGKGPMQCFREAKC